MSAERLDTVRRILGNKGTLQQAADAIGVSKQRLWRIARHYNLRRRTYRNSQTLAKQKWWAENDPQAVA